MRTLTKERVNLSGLFNDSGVLNLELIGDGPNEVVAKALAKFSKDNESVSLASQQASLVKNEEERKKNLAVSFIDKYTEIFKINRNQLGELINSLKTEDILVLENQLAGMLRKKRLLANTGIFACLGALSTSTVVLSSSPAGISLFCFTLIFVIIFWGHLSENFYSENSIIHVPYRPVGHLALRRYLKKKYGPQYFPYQELKEELGLVENINKE